MPARYLSTRFVLSIVVLNAEYLVSAMYCGSSRVVMLTWPRLQVMGEPAPGQPGHLLERPWFLEQVRGAWHDLQARLAPQLLDRLAVELDDHSVTCPDDQQGRLAYRAQVLAGEVGAATAGDDRRHRAGPPRGRDKRGGGARAGAQQPDPPAGRGPGSHHPVRPGRP